VVHIRKGKEVIIRVSLKKKKRGNGREKAPPGTKGKGGILYYYPSSKRGQETALFASGQGREHFDGSAEKKRSSLH